MTLEQIAIDIERLRTNVLFGSESLDPVSSDGLDSLEAEEHLSCIAYLELAHRAARKAVIHQARRSN